MKKDKSENTQVKVKKQYNVVKRMILYNIILIVAVIFLGSLIVFGVKYDSLKTRNRENLLTASKKTAENTDTILTLLDRISSTLFLGQEFQNAAEEYRQKHSDESYAKISSVFSAYSSLTSIINEVAYIPSDGENYDYSNALRFGKRTMRYDENGAGNDDLSFLDPYMRDIPNAKLVVIDLAKDNNREEFILCRTILDMRPTSAFYKKMGLGMFSVGKSSFLSEINLGAFAENFGFEARYGEIKIVSSGDCFALEKSDTYSVDLQNENWKIVGYQTGALGDSLETAVVSIAGIGPIAMIVCVVFSYLINSYTTKSYRYFIETFNRAEKSGGKIQMEMTEDEKLNEVAESYNLMMRKLEEVNKKMFEEQKKSFDLQMENTTFELRALYSQINKHFLFNALNMVRAMINSGEREKAVKSITDISVFLRYSLNQDDSLTIKSELKMLRSYIEIQRSRYGNFQFVVELEDGTEDAAIPKMVLQPIIENSFSHGSIGEDGIIKVSVKRRSGGILIGVFDNGLGISAERRAQVNENLRNDVADGNESHNGLALINVQRRLRLLCSENCRIRIFGTKGKFTAVIVNLADKENV